MAETPCYRRASELFDLVEHKIHGFGGPEWHAQEIRLPEAPDEELIMWVRDIEHCADMLVGRPDLQGQVTFTPEIIYDGDDINQIISQMPTARRWHEVLVGRGIQSVQRS